MLTSMDCFYFTYFFHSVWDLPGSCNDNDFWLENMDIFVLWDRILFKLLVLVGFFSPLATLCGIGDLSFLTRDGTCTPLHWERRVLTTGLPGNPLSWFVLALFCQRRAKSRSPTVDPEERRVLIAPRRGVMVPVDIQGSGYLGRGWLVVVGWKSWLLGPSDPIPVGVLGPLRKLQEVEV